MTRAVRKIRLMDDDELDETRVGRDAREIRDGIRKDGYRAEVAITEDGTKIILTSQKF